MEFIKILGCKIPFLNKVVHLQYSRGGDLFNFLILVLEFILEAIRAIKETTARYKRKAGVEPLLIPDKIS